MFRDEVWAQEMGEKRGKIGREGKKVHFELVS